MKRLTSFSWILLASTVSLTVQAVENVSFNGFLTAGATYMDSDVGSQDGTISNNVDFSSDSRLGIQIASEINAEVSITGQLLAKGNKDGYDMAADWAFVTYKVSDPLSIRTGKIKLTTFLISDYFEVGYAYPWIRPPSEVYSANPINALNGIDVLYRMNFGDMSLLVQPYFGVSRGEQALRPQETLPTAAQIIAQLTGNGVLPAEAATFAQFMPQLGQVHFLDFDANKMRGINLALTSNIFTLRAGWLKTLVSQDDFGVVDDEAEFASIGLTADWKNIVVYSEYFEREIEGGANAAFPNQKGSYVTLGYRTGRLLTHITQASLQDNDNPAPPPTCPSCAALEQDSTTLGFRYELGTGASLKLEVQNIEPEKGTRGQLLSAPSLDPKDPSDSVNVYSFAIDVVF